MDRKKDGWLDGQIEKIYEKNMDGWMDKKNGKKWMDGGYLKKMIKTMDDRMAKKYMDGGWIEKKYGWLDGQKKYLKKIWMVGWIKK